MTGTVGEICLVSFFCVRSLYMWIFILALKISEVVSFSALQSDTQIYSETTVCHWMLLHIPAGFVHDLFLLWRVSKTVIHFSCDMICWNHACLCIAVNNFSDIQCSYFVEVWFLSGWVWGPKARRSNIECIALIMLTSPDGKNQLIHDG